MRFLLIAEKRAIDVWILKTNCAANTRLHIRFIISQSKSINATVLTTTDVRTHVSQICIQSLRDKVPEYIRLITEKWELRLRPNMVPNLKNNEMFYETQPLHDDVIKWKHFPRNWPFVRGIHRSPMNSPYKGQWRGALMFSLIWDWINGWLNSRKAGLIGDTIAPIMMSL